MEAINTEVKRGMFDKAISATSYAPLENGMQLKITTHKGHRGTITTYAQAVNIGKTSGGFTGESFMMFQDFNRVMMNHEQDRATEKNIRQCHAKALEVEFISVMIEANQFYKGKPAPQVD